jgi:hypothetical protein
LKTPAAGNISLANTDQSCHYTLFPEQIEQLIRKDECSVSFRARRVRRGDTDRSAAMRLKAAGMRTPRSEYLNLSELKAEESQGD